MAEVWKVEVWESERGWGRKPFFTKEFEGPKAKEEAHKFYTEENAKNTGPVPDWYTYAEKPYAEMKLEDGTVLRSS